MGCCASSSSYLGVMKTNSGKHTHSPKALLFAAFYCNGLNFVLRGGEEHAIWKDIHYWWACSSIPAAAGESRFMENPIGHNVLSNYMKYILDVAGIYTVPVNPTTGSEQLQLVECSRRMLHRSWSWKIWPTYQRQTGSIWADNCTAAESCM